MTTAEMILERVLVERIYEYHYHAARAKPGEAGRKHREIARELKAALRTAEDERRCYCASLAQDGRHCPNHAGR